MTVVVECAAISLLTSARILVAVNACVFINPLWTRTLLGTPGKSWRSSGSRRIFRSVRTDTLGVVSA